VSPEKYTQKLELFGLINSRTLQFAEIDCPGLVITEEVLP